MGKQAISVGQLLINNVVVPYVPNTFKFTEGFGEYKQRGAVVGSGRSEVVFSEDAESKLSKVMFELYPTAENIELARAWKAGKSSNVIEYIADGMQRTITTAAIINDYENEIGADTTISLEWMGDPAS